ncbi:MAG: hypothetical protein RR942_06240 [Romboutsia sp.]
MDIEEIMTQVKGIMDTYNLNFEEALEIFKVKKTQENIQYIAEKLDNISMEIEITSKNIDNIREVLSYTK